MRTMIRVSEKVRTAKYHFGFMPGHAGVRNNECAGKIASLAPITSSRAMDRVDNLNAI